VLEDFTQTLFAIRERHANTVPIMAEAVMEVKRNYGKQPALNSLEESSCLEDFFTDIVES
jgi:Mitochondrial branched-chain alpha-ketoacid dehydrogenase kinase